MDLNLFFHFTNHAAGLLKPVAGQYAYLDPGSGSFLLQLLAAALLGGLFLLKTYWAKVTTFVRRIFNKHQDSAEDDE